MTSAQPMDARIENYLSRLETAMGRTSPGEKHNILREISAHIVDSVAGSSNPQAAVDRVLGLLGTPEQLDDSPAFAQPALWKERSQPLSIDRGYMVAKG